jgi:hypothetical protein
MPLWTLKGMEGGYEQKDNFSCGPIALNRFASQLKSLSGDVALDESVNAFVRSPEELMETNVTNAKDLLEALIKRMHDLFNDSEDGKEGEEGKPPVTGSEDGK